jgi:hypothetical protein
MPTSKPAIKFLMIKPGYVYILSSRTGTLYTGVTSDLIKRDNPEWKDLAKIWGRRIAFPSESTAEIDARELLRPPSKETPSL